MPSWATVEGAPFPQGVSWIEDEQAYNFALYSKTQPPNAAPAMPAKAVVALNRPIPSPSLPWESRAVNAAPRLRYTASGNNMGTSPAAGAPSKA